MFRSLSAFFLRNNFTPARLRVIEACSRSPYCLFSTTTGNGEDGKGDASPTPDDGEENDEFAVDGFEADDEEEDLDVDLDALSDTGKQLTPQLADDLVAKMVAATTRRFEGPRRGGEILSSLSPHTISVMRASRITTNKIHAAQSEFLPHAIEKKVSAEVNVELLGLSRMAQEALRILSGRRWKQTYIKLSCNHYPSLQENRAHIVSQIDRLVAASKSVVGEEVDATPLESWDDVVAEVKRQAHEEIEEAGDVSLILGETKS